MPRRGGSMVMSMVLMCDFGASGHGNLFMVCMDLHEAITAFLGLDLCTK